jgi:hypothetical protein
VRGLADILHTMRDVKQHTVILSMTLLAGAASFFVGNAYSSQMPGFASDLGHGDPGMSYSMLLAADAAGGLLAGLALEGGGLLPPRPRTAIMLALSWCAALMVFALSRSYARALCFLFAAGFLELSFNAMAQSLVQLNAPLDMRGRVIDLFNMASLGLRPWRDLGRPARQLDRHSLVAGAVRAGDHDRGGRIAGHAVRQLRCARARQTNPMLTSSP